MTPTRPLDAAKLSRLHQIEERESRLETTEDDVHWLLARLYDLAKVMRQTLHSEGRGHTKLAEASRTRLLKALQRLNDAQ